MLPHRKARLDALTKNRAKIVVGTKFQAIDISSYYGVVEAIDGETACCWYATCFTSGRDKIPLDRLADPYAFTLEFPDTIPE
jgi:hypothetical protein